MICIETKGPGNRLKAHCPIAHALRSVFEIHRVHFVCMPNMLGTGVKDEVWQSNESCSSPDE